MSLKLNVLASYASQIYVMFIGIVMVPMYVGYMGVEAYGLVGFFAMLQAWFQLLDMGLTPTMTRAAATFAGGARDPLALRRLVRALETLFLGVALIGTLALWYSAGTVASDWLRVETLPLDQVRTAIELIALTIALRWMAGLYRAALMGFERIVWLSAFSTAVATVRFVLVIPFFVYVGSTPTAFFAYQAVVAALELLVLLVYTYRILPPLDGPHKVNWQFGAVRGVLTFSLSIAFTSSVWVLVTQTDKLVLSKLLPLSEYAYFTLAVLVASGVAVVSGPISGALLPRLTRLCAQGEDGELVRLYRNATQLVAVIAIPAALMLAIFSERVLWAWTGDAQMTAKAAPVLTLYAIGNGILAMGAFPYYLQFAKGDLRLHLIGNAFFVVVLIPTVVWATLAHGVTGAGYAWLGTNLAYFALWVPRVHRRFFPGLQRRWLLEDVAGVVALPTLLALLMARWVPWPAERVATGVLCCALGALLLACAALSSPFVRHMLIRRWPRVHPGTGFS